MDKQKYKLIKKVLDDKPDGIIKTAYEKPNGKYILKVEYKGQFEWIEMGHATDIYDEELDWSFQVTFKVSEAMKYGYKMSCNSGIVNDRYRGLTCDFSNLILEREIIKTSYGMGHHLYKEVYRCSKCNQLWQINEEYDSHMGTTIKCHKL